MRRPPHSRSPSDWRGQATGALRSRGRGPSSPEPSSSPEPHPRSPHNFRAKKEQLKQPKSLSPNFSILNAKPRTRNPKH